MASCIAGGGLPLLELRTHPVKGRSVHVAAAGGIPPGTTLFAEVPFASVVVTKVLCTVCYAVADPDLCCDDCSEVSFCSEACQQRLKVVHDLECSTLEDIHLIAKKSRADRHLLCLITRILCTRAAATLPHKVAASAPMITTMYSDVVDMVHATKELSPAWLASVQAGAELILKSLPSECAVSVPEVVGLAARINENSYSLDANTADATGQVASVGLFPLAGLINHSCQPNCIWSTDPSKGAMVVRTTAFIPHGDEITVPYIDVHQPRHARQRQLKETKHFDCRCDRCNEVGPAAADTLVDGVCCRGCGGHELLVPCLNHRGGSYYYTCPKCNGKVSNDVVDAVKAKADAAIQSAQAKMDKKEFKQAQSILDTFWNDKSAVITLHPCHWMATTAVRLLSDCAFKAGMYLRCYDLRKRLVMQLEATLPPNSLALGTAYLELATAGTLCLKHKVWTGADQDERIHREQVKAHYDRCLGIRKVCYADHHPRLMQVQSQALSV
ncbi:hypothetical protein DYB38_013006 [Aphanomyces astaci]|uniref:SET domain-containing protein n=1 Tax=Aphanomyces astaci TaxID=112090 RepID=A0A397E464_APHAT|nr:hypothetical protein DYB38_013006 [Aphanomyces astaci]